jgi:hypothetical protein
MAPKSTLVPVSMVVPPGEWIDWHTHHVVSGPAVAHRTFTIAETGVYVRAGSIVVTKVRTHLTCFPAGLAASSPLTCEDCCPWASSPPPPSFPALDLHTP